MPSSKDSLRDADLTSIAIARLQHFIEGLKTYEYNRNVSEGIYKMARTKDPITQIRSNDRSRRGDPLHRQIFEDLAWEIACQEVTSKATGIIDESVDPDSPQSTMYPTIRINWNTIQQTYFPDLVEVAPEEKEEKIKEAQERFSNAVLSQYGKSLTKGIAFQTLYGENHPTDLSMLGLLTEDAVQKAGQEVAPEAYEKAKQKWREDIKIKTLDSVEHFYEARPVHRPSFKVDETYSHIRTIQKKLTFSMDRLRELIQEARSDVVTATNNFDERVRSGSRNLNAEYVFDGLRSRDEARFRNLVNPTSRLWTALGLVYEDRHLSEDEWRRNGNLSDELFLPAGVSLYEPNDGSTSGCLLPTVAETPNFPDVVRTPFGYELMR